MLRSANAVAAICGPLVVLGYLIGATARTWTLSRQPGVTDPYADPDALTLDDVDDDGAPDVADPPTESGLPPGTALEVLSTLAAATIAWHAVETVAPGAMTSAIGPYSPQVLTMWQSVALWAGLAAVVGHMAPIWTRFERGSSGLVSAIALGAVYTPVLLLVALAGFFGAMLLNRTPVDAVPVALVAVAVAEWLAWWFDLPWGWGMVNGPELALWVTVLAAILFTRWRTAAAAGRGISPPRP